MLIHFKKSLATDEISKADALRDKIYAGYKKAVQAYLTLPLKDYTEAAVILNQHIIDYKICGRDQLNKETGALLGFIKDLETVHQSLVNKLHLNIFVEQLKLANDTVNKHTNIRTNERSAKIADAMKQARIACEVLSNKLCHLVFVR